MKTLKGKIIFLNGPSSSGKTTLAKSLQKNLPEPYLHIGIDKLIEMMPSHLNNWEGGKAHEGFWWEESIDENGNPLQNIKLGPFAKKISDTLIKVVIAMVENGINVIVDEICIVEDSFSKWQKSLSNYNVIYIRIKAPLSILIAREKQRNDRMPNSARAQYLRVHKGNKYDLEIDTSSNTLEESTQIILKKMR